MLGTILGLVSAGIGLYQTIEAGNQADEQRNNRPTYQVPSEADELVDIYRRRTQETKMPGQAAAEVMVRSSTATGVAQSREVTRSASDLQSSVTDLYGQQTQALTDLQVQADRRRAQSEPQYAQALGQRAQYSDQAFQWNQTIPWQVGMNALMARQQAGYNTISAGLSLAATSGQGTDWGSMFGTGNDPNMYIGNPSLMSGGLNLQTNSIFE